MNKSELVKKMAEKSGLSENDTEKALNAFTKTVEDTLKKGDKLQLIGFGNFEVVEKPERTMKNIQDPTKTILVAKHFAPKFKPGKALKEYINK